MKISHISFFLIFLLIVSFPLLANSNKKISQTIKNPYAPIVIRSLCEPLPECAEIEHVSLLDIIIPKEKIIKKEEHIKNN